MAEADQQALRRGQSNVDDPTKVVPALEASQDFLESWNLFKGQRELIIRHAGQDYHLKITRQDKLILTK